MMIDFPTKAWKKIDDAKKIISEFEGLDISDPIMFVEISRQFSRDYDFNWLTNTNKMMLKLPKVLKKIIENRKSEFDYESENYERESFEEENKFSIFDHEELMKQYTISTLKEMYVMFSEFASSRFRFSAVTFEEMAKQRYGDYSLEISLNLDWLSDEGYTEDLGYHEKWKCNVYRIIPISME